MSETERILAIGDIHGHGRALEALLNRIETRADDQVVFLGDYVDKGPNVKAVLDLLVAFGEMHSAIFLRGNHDQMMLGARADPASMAIWETLGGSRPLASYGEGPVAEVLPLVPPAHWDFLENRCRNYFATADYIFVHGGIRPDVKPEQEEPERLQWMTLASAEPHLSGRTVICGHSSQASGEIADLGHTICIDTGITKGKWLSCLALDTFEFWQVNEQADYRSGRLR